MWVTPPQKKIKKGTSPYYEYSLIKKRLPLRQHPENHSHHRHGDRSLCGKHHPIWYSDAGTSGFPGTPDLHGYSLVEHIPGHALYRPDRLPDLLFPADRRFLPYFQQKEIRHQAISLCPAVGVSLRLCFIRHTGKFRLSERFFHSVSRTSDHLGNRHSVPQSRKPDTPLDRENPDCCRRLSRRLAFTDRLRLQRHHPDPVTLPVP